MKKIVLLVDFSPVSQLALEHVKLLAGKKPMEVVLLHIAGADKRGNEQELRDKVKQFAALLVSHNIPFSVQIDYGDFFEIVGESLRAIAADLLVVGTHGITVKGSFAGSNILRLLNLVETPALIVQLQSQIPTQGYLKALLPLPAKANEAEVIREVGDFAGVYDSSIHILSFYNESNHSVMHQSATSISEGLKKMGSKVALDMERTDASVSSYFRSIVELSDIEEAEVIVLMITPKFEGVFNTEDQENILLNRLGKPILCI